MIQFKEFKTWQWVFVAFLVIITLASIVAEFAGSHGSSKSHETEAAVTPAVHDSHDSHAAVTEHGGGHGGHWWSGIPMFWIWFGALGTFAITIFAKKILGSVIYKKEDYYNE